MAIALRAYLVPNQLTYLKITGGNPNSSGVLVFNVIDTLELSQAGLGRFVSFEAVPRQVLDMIVNSDSFVENNVVQRISFSATLRELVPSNIMSAIQQVVMGFSHIRVEAGYASPFAPGTTVVKVAVAGVWDTGNGIGVQEGQNVNEISILPAGVNSAGGTGFWVGLLAGTIPF